MPTAVVSRLDPRVMVSATAARCAASQKIISVCGTSGVAPGQAQFCLEPLLQLYTQRFTNLPSSHVALIAMCVHAHVAKIPAARIEGQNSHVPPFSWCFPPPAFCPPSSPAGTSPPLPCHRVVPCCAPFSHSFNVDEKLQGPRL